MPPERVYLIRHGQTDWNVEGRWQGFESVPLNETGVSQARALAEYLRRPLTAIYSSDLLRAMQTAEILGQAVGVAPTPESRLREFNLGIFQGLTFEEIRATYPEEAASLRTDYMGYQVPGGESRYQLQARAFDAWNSLVEAAEGEVALVSHGGTIKVLLLKLFGDTPELRAMHIENTSISTIVRNGTRWALMEVGVTPHLSAPVTDRDHH